jgi:hypothetical protein
MPVREVKGGTLDALDKILEMPCQMARSALTQCRMLSTLRDQKREVWNLSEPYSSRLPFRG